MRYDWSFHTASYNNWMEKLIGWDFISSSLCFTSVVNRRAKIMRGSFQVMDVQLSDIIS